MSHIRTSFLASAGISTYVTEMTVRLKISVQSLSALPGLSKQTVWLDSGKSLSNSADDERLNSVKQAQYTSLRDLITESPFKNRQVGSKTHKDHEWCDLSEIKFKNKLLKEAAKAYLQPTGEKPAPHTPLLTQYWKSFCEKNKLVVVSVKEYFKRQVEACVKFFWTQAFAFFQNFKTYHSGLLKQV